MAPLRALVVLCLLHLSVQGIRAEVSLAALAKIINYFDENVQPKADAQYAIAISVPLDQCTKEDAVIEDVFSKEDAQKVKDVISKGKICVLCTKSSNVIATRPNGKTKEHSEHILLYPLDDSPMNELLKKADEKSCVVFYSYNSPCVTKCIQSADNILSGLSNWKNIRKENNVFVFNKIWQKDAWRKDMEKDLLKINEVPLYRCNKTNKMECQKCVEKNTQKVIAFCLPKK
ncbi:uncharacterized protein si:dkey-96g2.1 [Puntigrus tetrazona]|uniref:uncharacterized protein si:dkey-96g2.1 n=1 Tax=Puntigrus tetrazona TaxID=1606681 RepID=UPI001C8934ED|nr:uncharacterized protein si:dkey-96g2.1 [Puntigrus tetrazona]